MKRRNLLMRSESVAAILRIQTSFCATPSLVTTGSEKSKRPLPVTDCFLVFFNLRGMPPQLVENIGTLWLKLPTPLPAANHFCEIAMTAVHIAHDPEGIEVVRKIFL
jgi:hypothetical protein